MANVAASVRQRLLNLSKAQQRPFQEVLQFYAMERFLYRLSQSSHADRFVLKGALMLQVWQSLQSRPTMDIDMLGRLSNDASTVLDTIGEVLTWPVAEDGLSFHPDTLRAEQITEDSDYQGLRIRALATLDRAEVHVQMDIGFGDQVIPAPQRQHYPVLLDHAAPELLCYSRESAIAEKLQAMTMLGELNSRMKDFYDIWLLARQFSFDRETLTQAIFATFNQRRTALPQTPLFDGRFAAIKQTQWQAFLHRLGDDVLTEKDFARVLASIEQFAGTALALSDNDSEIWHWPAGGPWECSSPHRRPDHQ